MVNPFIRNHQYNLIKKQANLLQNACNTVSDPKVVEAVRSSTLTKIIDAFPEATELQKQHLERVSTLNRTEDFQHYLHTLNPLMLEFTQVTAAQIKKLFPKVKKLKIPDLVPIDYRFVTYIGWTDIASNRLFLVYEQNGQHIGIEGKFTPTNKKSTCFLCNRHEEVALFTAITKSKPAHASPDYYKAIGNYMCVNSEACNKNISDTTALEKFISNLYMK
ncbi:FusB/FusC family EF-G-binding protein [Paenibacillus sp. PL91]|uniref:FusB/FusC family EF-G-binding protein n=1 Tax=Paenibacillus sp. PL91 TaxID=2729538 RepID=UPI00145F11D3|nr:FusB/FusC family EF-G-binding protein [Paenibacillus sp. PL91]MBC9199144.1 FusB/FusC family EF-G-binding protein [Paenibacillus sp. PL91]